MDSPQPGSPEIEGQDEPDLPMTMPASTVLMQLPRDATAVLAAAGRFPKEKVVVKFKPVANAPLLAKPSAFQVPSKNKVEYMTVLLRKKLKITESEGLFLYVSGSFAPALDEVVGNLWRCFKDSNDHLIIWYAMTPSFG